MELPLNWSLKVRLLVMQQTQLPSVALQSLVKDKTVSLHFYPYKSVQDGRWRWRIVHVIDEDNEDIIQSSNDSFETRHEALYDAKLISELTYDIEA